MCVGARGVGGSLKDSELEREEVSTPAPSLQLHNLLEKKKSRERVRQIDQWRFGAQLSFSSPLKCQYGKQWEEEGFNRMYAELTGHEVMTRGPVPPAFVWFWFCLILQIYIQHIHSHQMYLLFLNSSLKTNTQVVGSKSNDWS